MHLCKEGGDMTPNPEDFTSYVDSSPFTALFDKESRVRIFDVLLSKHHQELSETDLAELAGIDRSTVYRVIPKLVDSGLVTEDDNEGGTTLYSLNQDHPAAEPFMEARHKLTISSHQIAGEPSGDPQFNPEDVDPSTSSAADIRENTPNL